MTKISNPSLLAVAAAALLALPLVVAPTISAAQTYAQEMTHPDSDYNRHRAQERADAERRRQQDTSSPSASGPSSSETVGTLFVVGAICLFIPDCRRTLMGD